MLHLSDCFEPDTERAAGEVIDGEAIIINLLTGAYYSMGGVGAHIWSLIERRHSGTAILARVVDQYDVEPPAAEADLRALLAQLLEEGLVRPTAIPAAVETIPAVVSKQPYTRPGLEAYRDMQDLLALDPPAPGLAAISWKDAQAAPKVKP